MRKLKQALSLSLALVLSLALAVPAFADSIPIPGNKTENNWNLGVDGKADEEVFFAGEKTFKLRDWLWPDYDENYMRTVTKTDVTEYTLSQLVIPKKGDTVVITNGGEAFYSVSMMAWSDPDGDGVYDNRLMMGGGGKETIQPADIAGPLASGEPFASDQWYFNLFDIQQNANVGEDGEWTADPGEVWISSGEGVWGKVTELRIPVDQLLEEFGPNTLFSILVGDREGWYVFLEDGAAVTEPTTPVEPEQPAKPETAMPTNDKLTVDGTLADPTVYKIDGSNYFKIRDVAALLNGTEKQFSVGYDGALKSVTATTGEGYAKLDTDLTGAPAGGNKTADPSNDTIYVNGEKIDATVYKIDGGNYFKLRDLGKALNFSVDWNREQGMMIDTSKPYTE